MNETVFRYLNNLAFQSSVFDSLVVFSAVFLVWLLVAGVFAYALYPGRETKMSSWHVLGIVFISAFIAWFIGEAINVLYPVARPISALEGSVNTLVLKGGMDAFPSGHAAFAFALATAMLFFKRSIGALLLIGAVLVGVSRIIAGVHWPLDIIAGGALGMVTAIAASFLWKTFPRGSSLRK